MKRNPFVFVLICALLLCGCSLHDESIDRVRCLFHPRKFDVKD